MVLVARPVATEVTQIGVEAVGASGVKVPCNRVLQALGFTMDPSVDIAVFGPAGQLYDTAAVVNREWATGGITGQPDYREVAFALCGIFGDPLSITEVTTGVHDWVWEPKSIGGLDNPRTFSLQQGVVGISAEGTTFATLTAFNQNFSREGGNDQGGSFFSRRLDWDAALDTNEVQQVAITGGPTGGTFTLTFSGQTTTGIPYNATAAQVQTALEALSNIVPGDVRCTGGPLPSSPVLVEWRGNYARENAATMTATPSLTGGTTPAVAITTPTTAAEPVATDITPIMPGEINVYLDDLYSAIGTTQYTGDFAAGWGIGGRRNPVWTLNRELDSFASVVELKPDPTFTLSVNDDAVGRQLLPIMRTGASKFLRIECVGQVITGAYNYEYVADFHGKIVEAPGRGDVSGVRSLDWSFRTMHSGAWGKAMRFRLRTDIASLAAV